MRTAGFRCPTGFMHYPSDLPGSTETLTPAATRSESEDGRKPVLGAPRTMEANEPTSPEGESADDESVRETAVAVAEDHVHPAFEALVAGTDAYDPEVALAHLHEAVDELEELTAEETKSDSDDDGGVPTE